MDKKKKTSKSLTKRSGKPPCKEVFEEEKTQRAQRKDGAPRAKKGPLSEEDTTVTKDKKDKKGMLVAVKMVIDTEQKQSKTPAVSTKGLAPEVESAVAVFLKHATESPLETIRAEYKTLSEAGGVPSEKPHANQSKARYPDIPCFETTRIVMKSTDTSAPTDEFVHANRVTLEHSEREYIAAQAPKEDQIELFWKMVFQELSPCVLCLTPFAEDGETKCEEFWPMETNQYKYFGKMFLNNKKVELQEHYTVYTMEVLPEGCSNSFLTRLVHYVEWPDKGVAGGRDLLKMLRWIKTLEKGPGKVLVVVLVPNLVTEMRKQRALAVSNELQYLFIYSTILDYVRAKMPKHVPQVNKFFKSIKDL